MITANARLYAFPYGMHPILARSDSDIGPSLIRMSVCKQSHVKLSIERRTRFQEATRSSP